MAISRPKIDVEDAVRLAEELYGMKVDEGSVKQLCGYDDRNFFLQAAKGDGGDDDDDGRWNPDGYVLKVTNAVDSKQPNLLEGQNDCMVHLAGKGLSVPRPIDNVLGRNWSVEGVSDDDERCVVRMLTYVPGRTLRQVKPRTTQLLHQAGAFVAKLDDLCSDFHHPSFSARDGIWLLKSLPNVAEFLTAVEDDADRQMCRQIIQQFSQEVAAHVDQFESGLIHGDFNDCNILVSPRSDVTDPSSIGGNNHYISGVIDFGDAVVSPYLFELAVTIMYMMVNPDEELDANLVGGHVLAGYSTVRTVPEREMELLPLCVAGRFAQSLVLGQHYFQQFPTNDYVLSTAKSGGWRLLKNFWRTQASTIVKQWKDIMRSYAKD